MKIPRKTKLVNFLSVQLAYKLEKLTDSNIDMEDYKIESNITEDINYFRDVMQIEFNQDFS